MTAVDQCKNNDQTYEPSGRRPDCFVQMTELFRFADSSESAGIEANGEHRQMCPRLVVIDVKVFVSLSLNRNQISISVWPTVRSCPVLLGIGKSPEEVGRQLIVVDNSGVYGESNDTKYWQQKPKHFRRSVVDFVEQCQQWKESYR